MLQTMDGKELKWMGSSLKDFRQHFLMEQNRRLGISYVAFSLVRIPIIGGHLILSGLEYGKSGLKSLYGIYRVIYVAKFKEAVYVLHAYPKEDQENCGK